MELHAKLVRSQLSFFKPFVAGLSLEATRKGQDKLGELMTALHRREVLVRDHDFKHFQGAWVMPKDQRRTGVILYLHGGGYTCGSLEYAKGFAAALASECGVRVFCPAYRLAPEHPYPAALDDALESYQYLLQKGYEPGQIMLAGESAGGGLIYCLCLKLKELGMELPCGLIGISPWTDLTGSGDSYRENRENDPSMTPELLQFYAGCYTQDPTDPLCSPLFGDLTGLPPSLLFVGGDEVMLDDTRALHEKLLAAGCRSRLHIAPERWHAYVLYCLNENMEQDFEAINHFLDRTLSPARSLRWMRLDNAAKIYPAAKRRNWNNFFRLSATLTEPIDVPVLRAALDVTVRRFPSMAVRLRRGVFWYYLEEIPQAPEIQPEKSCPLAHVPFGQVRRCAFRVLVYHNRVAVEFFHAVTDGTGGLIFLKTLVAEYLCQKYGITVPAEKGVLGRLEEPSPRGAGGQLPALCRGRYRQPGGEHRLSPQRHAGKGRLQEPGDHDGAGGPGAGVRKEIRGLRDGAAVRRHDAGHRRPAGGEGAPAQPPQAGEGAAAGESADPVPQPHACGTSPRISPRRSIPAPGTIPSPRSAPPCTTGWAWRTTPTPCAPSSPPMWPARSPRC